MLVERHGIFFVLANKNPPAYDQGTVKQLPVMITSGCWSKQDAAFWQVFLLSV